MLRLDTRLQKAADLFEPCDTGADIGSDHGRLPAWLLQSNKCRSVIVSDISPDALAHAVDLFQKHGLSGCADFILADGLDALTRPAGCVSLTGMGGRVMAGVLLRGADRLKGASLVLSAQTDLPCVRAAVAAIHYRFIAEEPVFCSGRYYLVFKAVPGEAKYSERELAVGTELLTSRRDETARAYFLHREQYFLSCLRGLSEASVPDESAIIKTQRLLTWTREVLDP